VLDWHFSSASVVDVPRSIFAWQMVSNAVIGVSGDLELWTHDSRADIGDQRQVGFLKGLKIENLRVKILPKPIDLESRQIAVHPIAQPSMASGIDSQASSRSWSVGHCPTDRLCPDTGLPICPKRSGRERASMKRDRLRGLWSFYLPWSF
jgi:hypothetical protein